MSSGLTLSLPALYGWVLFDAVLIGVQMFFTGVAAGRLRRKYFTKAFFEEHFPTLLKSTNYKLVGGYPDMGHGRFADKLSDDDWITFNNYQRAHYNYLEGSVPVVVSLLISGLQFTRSAAIAGLIYIVGRQLYSSAYCKSGAGGRAVGVAMLDLALLYLTGTSLYTSFTIAGGVEGFKLLLGF